MEKIKESIVQKLKNEGLTIDVIAREKHVYGLYKKMKLKFLLDPVGSVLVL